MNLEKALQIEGWMSYIELGFLATVAAESKVIVEFGCFKGRSTRVLADNTNGIVYAIDPWHLAYHSNNNNILWNPDPEIFATFNKNLKEYIEIEKVIPFNIPSNEFKFIDNVDFVFIDGDHRYEQVLEDIEIGKKLLKNGGVLAGHDYIHKDWPGVKKAVDKCFPEIQQIDSIWWVIL